MSGKTGSRESLRIRGARRAELGTSKAESASRQTTSGPKITHPKSTRHNLTDSRKESGAWNCRWLVATPGTPRWGWLAGPAPQRVVLQRKSGEKRRPHRSRGRRRVGSLPPVSQLHRTPTASCPADIGPFPRCRPNLHFTLPTLLIGLCRPGISLARLGSQSRVRDRLGHFLLEFPHLFLETIFETPKNREASTSSIGEGGPSLQ